RSMVQRGEADALVPERVWQELSRGLMEKSPTRMLAVLRECGALARVTPELDGTFSEPQVPEHLAARLEHAASRGFPLATRFALLVLVESLEDAASLAARVNAPVECRDL